MPNKRSVDKVCVSVWIPRTLRARLNKIAKAQKITLTELVESIYYNATRSIELSSDDYLAIAKETEKAEVRAQGGAGGGKGES